MAGILDSEAYYFVKNYSGSGNLLDETANNHDSDAITNALFYDHNATDGNYYRSPGLTTNFMEVPDATKFDITDNGDLDVRLKVALDDWSSTTFQYMIGKQNSTATSGWTCDMGGTSFEGKLRFLIGNGTFHQAYSTVANGFTDGTKQGIRYTYDSSASDINFYTLDDPDADLGTGSWTLLGAADVTMPGATVSTNNNDTVNIFHPSSYSRSTLGQLYEVQVYDGINGTLVLDWDADDYTEADIEAGTHTDNESNVFTITQAGTAELARIVNRGLFWHDTNALISIPDDPALDFDPTSDVWTYGLAFRTYDTSPAADAVLMAKKANLTTGDGYASYLESSDATAKGVIADGANTDTDISGNLTAGRAHTLIVRFDGAETEIFLDGTGGGPTTTALAADAANASKLTFGSISGGGSYSQMEWWSAAVVPLALSDGEVTTLHTALLTQIASTVITPSTVNAPWTIPTVGLKASFTPATVAAPWVKPAPGAVAVLSPGTIGAAWTVPSPSFIGARAAARFKLLADSISRFGLAADETSQLELLADEVTRLELKSE